MRKEKAERIEFLIDPDTERGRWLIKQLKSVDNKSEICRQALEDFFDPPAPPPDPRVDQLHTELSDVWDRVGELERQVAFLQGQLTTYQNDRGGFLSRLRGQTDDD